MNRKRVSRTLGTLGGVRLHRGMLGLLRGAVLGGFVLFGASSVEALPRYTARYGQDCRLCHHNPTGGGLRSLYASQFLIPTEMVMKTMSPEQIEKIQPQVSESITLGTDIRMVHHLADRERQPPELNFFQMQADLYVRFQADPHFSAYLDRGQSETRELFGLARILPWTGYIKFGRFTPDFGWKMADHRQFTREGRTGDALTGDLFFEPPANTDVGIEAGIAPGGLSLVVGAFNGTRGTPFDFDKKLGSSVRALYRFHLGPVGVGTGGSWWRNEEQAGRRNAGGPFGYVHLWRLTWLGEADWSNLDPAGPRPDPVPEESSRMAFLTSHELTLQVVRGLDLRTVYNFADPDIDEQTGFRVKMGAGLDALVSPFFGVRGMVNVYHDHGGVDVTELQYTQSEITLHLFY